MPTRPTDGDSQWEWNRQMDKLKNRERLRGKKRQMETGEQRDRLGQMNRQIDKPFGL